MYLRTHSTVVEGFGCTSNTQNKPMSGILNRIPIQQSHLSQRIHQTTTDHLCSYSTSSLYRRVGLSKDITMVESEWNQEP